MPTESEQGWRYLDFERSEDETGVTTFEAMASVGADRWGELQAEVAALLSQLCQSGTAQQGPLDEGGDWDFDLQVVEDSPTPWMADFDPQLGRLQFEKGRAGQPRYSLTLTLTGVPACVPWLAECIHFQDE